MDHGRNHVHTLRTPSASFLCHMYAIAQMCAALVGVHPFSSISASVLQAEAHGDRQQMRRMKTRRDQLPSKRLHLSFKVSASSRSDLEPMAQTRVLGGVRTGRRDATVAAARQRRKSHTRFRFLWNVHTYVLPVACTRRPRTNNPPSRRQKFRGNQVQAKGKVAKLRPRPPNFLPSYPRVCGGRGGGRGTDLYMFSDDAHAWAIARWDSVRTLGLMPLESISSYARFALGKDRACAYLCGGCRFLMFNLDACPATFETHVCGHRTATAVVYIIAKKQVSPSCRASQPLSTRENHRQHPSIKRPKLSVSANLRSSRRQQPS